MATTNNIQAASLLNLPSDAGQRPESSIARVAVRLIVPAAEKSVKGEIAVITGAGQGIGRELAFQYASNGATVVCLDINREKNEETVKEIARLGHPKAHAYLCNVVNRDEVFRVATQIEKEVGIVTILINNAGILYAGSVLEASPESVARTMDVNVISHFWTIQAFLPKMLELNRGHIVAMSSCAGIVGIKYLTSYCASKYAVRGFMEALHSELMVDPNCEVKITTIFPHIVDTGLCKRPAIRFPTLMPMIRPMDAAKHIISAQRRNIADSSIPSFLFPINNLTRIFPAALGKALFDFMDVYVKPEF